ncbi:MAG: MFS transporter [Gammaproteobacteria bacterium]|nr:MFS transporter [Gammaproteobacteria bacterium]
MNSSNSYLWYMLCLICFVAPLGIQTVLLPWLIVVEMQESGARLGLAQFALQLPAILLILAGGLLADRFDRAKILWVCHGLAALPALLLAYVIYSQALSFQMVVVYALAMGSVTAFAQPARDGMLNQIASDDLQKGVTIAMGLTFGGQVIGFLMGGAAESVGAVSLLIIQAIVMAFGMFFAFKLMPMSRLAGETAALSASSGAGSAILEGLRLVFTSNLMRPVIFLVFCMSLFYGGAYMVLVPVVAREVYGAGAAEIAQCFVAFVGGTILVTGLLVKVGGLSNPLMALQLALLGGGLCLILASMVNQFEYFLGALALWGMCGAVAMSMSRTLIQQAAPEAYRSRVLAIFSLANMGGMPLGAVLLGALSVSMGGEFALWVAAASMAGVLLMFRVIRALGYWAPNEG